MIILKVVASLLIMFTFFISLLGLAQFVDGSEEGASVWLIWPVMAGLCLQALLAFYGVWSE